MTNHHVYTIDEIRTLKTLYPSGGVKAVQEKHPYLGKDQIKRAARRYGAAFSRKRYQSRPEWDILIERAALSGRKGALKECSRAIGKSYAWTKFRAEAMGLSYPREKGRNWCHEEDKILHDNAHVNAATLAKTLGKRGYTRTPSAIMRRRREIEVPSMKEARGWLSTSELADALGIPRPTVLSWLKRGMIRSAHCDTLEGVANVYHYFTPAAIRQFIVEYPAHIDLRRADRFWLIDLLVGGPADNSDDLREARKKVNAR